MKMIDSAPLPCNITRAFRDQRRPQRFVGAARTRERGIEAFSRPLPIAIPTLADGTSYTNGWSHPRPWNERK